MRKLLYLTITCLLVPNFTVTAQNVQTPAGLNSALSSNILQGAAVSLFGVNPSNCPLIATTQTWDGGRLIFSSSPIGPTNRGILYTDSTLTATPTGVTNRIYVYHINSNSLPMRFSVLIQNNGNLSGTLRISSNGIAGPGTSFSTISQTALLNWMTNGPKNTATLVPGQVVRVDTTFDTKNVNKGNLMNGIWDYTFTQPHTVFVCMLNASDNPITVGPTLPVLPRDGNERGTFTNCNKNYVTVTNTFVHTTAGIQQFPIGSNTDTFITGTDNASSSPTTETNFGNLGVWYKFQVSVDASDGRAFGFLLNPRGGAWSTLVNMPAGIYAGGIFAVPAGGGTLASNTFAVVAGGYSPGSGTNIQWQFMPAAGSNLPVRFLAVPYDAATNNPSGPTLDPISDYNVNPGQTVSFTATASDPDTNQTLTFSLGSAPPGATIDPASGHFSWRPPVASANTSTNVQVVVSDSNVPPMTATQTFNIAVGPLEPVTLDSSAISSGQFQLQASGTIGPDYILQANNSVTNAAGWVNVATNTPASSPFTLTDPNPAGSASMFYRVVLGP